MISKKTKLGITASTVTAAVVACASLLSGGIARGGPGEATVGTSKLYGAIPPDQIEHLSSSDSIKTAAASGSMMAIWETLEHGEKIECLDCIPAVEPLMYDANPRTREIAAWWLRRRMFGVFGPGQVYERTLAKLEGDPNPKVRAFAAEALGEFLVAPGVEACARAIERDADPTVRAAAAAALGRLNDDGRGAITRALQDADARVKLAALTSAGRINQFSDVTAVVGVLGDGDAKVRRRGVELLGTMRASDAVDGILALAKHDPDENVRNSACHALGSIRDPRARGVLQDLSLTDPDGLVRDQATIALRRL